MLIKFESNDGEHFVMRQDDAQVLLQMMGTSGTPEGALSGEDLSNALLKLKKSLRDETPIPQKQDQDDENTEDDNEPVVALSSRAAPLLEMLSQAQKEDSFVMWRPE
jgi:hypothetical protein